MYGLCKAIVGHSRCLCTLLQSQQDGRRRRHTRHRLGNNEAGGSTSNIAALLQNMAHAQVEPQDEWKAVKSNLLAGQEDTTERVAKRLRHENTYEFKKGNKRQFKINETVTEQCKVTTASVNAALPKPADPTPKYPTPALHKAKETLNEMYRVDCPTNGKSSSRSPIALSSAGKSTRLMRLQWTLTMRSDSPWLQRPQRTKLTSKSLIGAPSHQPICLLLAGMAQTCSKGSQTQEFWR